MQPLARRVWVVLDIFSRTVDGSLTAQLLEHLGGTSKSVTRLANGDVEDELLDAKLAHGVGGLGVGLAVQLAFCVRCGGLRAARTMVTAGVSWRRGELSKQREVGRARVRWMILARLCGGR